MNALFTKSNAVSEQAFWNFHPNQPKEGIPFNSKLTYFRKDISGRCVQRKWLSYNNEKQALYCSFCVMYAPEKSRKNQLIQGCSDWRHITVRIAEHEKSQCHQQSSEAYFVNIKGQSVKHKLMHKQLSIRQKQVLERRAVMRCVIDIIFFIGFQALSYRSKHSEAIVEVFDDDDDKILYNRGNFLEAVKLLADYDPTLRAHLKRVTEKAKKRDPTKRGRGSLVTFLSKTTVIKIFNIIGEMIKEVVVKDVKDAGMFSVQLDSTQDVSVHDQCAVVVRYVKDDKAREKLLRMVNVTDSKAQSLHELLVASLSEVGLKLDTCIGDSFDGAANMNGAYNGLQALLKQVRPSHIHTWCYAHVLNLVIADASSVCIQAVSLFGILNHLAKFFKESYKRMKVWEDQLKETTGQGKLRKLKLIGQTRW